MSWSSELDQMRQRIVGNRRELAALLRDRLNFNRCAFIARHHGMFSFMGFNAQQISTLREKHSVYIARFKTEFRESICVKR
ncbi:aminotransferase class I/II-fold pyridoxal phosphate-dependent enzyme [Paraburkholderia sp. BL6669N2]|uniref:aminotransferase class I/II-fold pyridoxal phosphate-dependent enzyme n=1 Tax=Paraburkholderia sp. BL6669N2 TaxID=1938807 RepID=UPI002161A070|nr:aminotransferase class I/II-fold pyridoxal phosphate-dependent enzyme [Paraburkholderia sp. BL6669N2]